MSASEETEHAPADDRHRSSRPATLHWREGGEARTHVVASSAILGSSPDVDVRIADPLVSRLHLELRPEADGLWIRDLGSRNGTYLNDLRIGSARAPSRATLRVGGTEIAIRHEREARRDVELWSEPRLGRLVGASDAMRALFAQLDKVARSDATVLVRGETGTGKELVAEAIHERSTRAGGPFVTIDCAALPEALLEAELFGHARGAFTGAIGAREGAFEAASSGTIFLDEIGELPLSMQPKLLRVLEAKTVRRVGETQHRPVDVRVVAATHRDLVALVARGEFREDLFFRLHVVPIAVPPLRERREDIRLLVAHFVGDGEPLAPALVERLVARPFRGNVRELRNLVERVRALGPTALDESADPLAPSPERDAEPDVEQDYRAYREAWIDLGEKRYAMALLARHDGNVSAASRAAGITRNYLHRLIRRHQL